MSDKKIFHISADFDLIKKPDWIDNFRQKYDKPFRYHITLKTETYFNAKYLKNLKTDLLSITKQYAEIRISFNKLFIGHSPKGECIMIRAEKNKNLVNLQKEITKKISNYGNHIMQEYEKFEKNFKPHITVARNLTAEQLKNAKNELGKNLYCEALIDKIVLTTVKNDLFEEWNNKKNKTYYKLTDE